MKKIIAIAVASLFAITAMAEGPAKTDTGINYNNVEVGYDTFILDDYDFTWTGYGLGGSFLISENIYATANYNSLTPETSGLDNASLTYVGLGYRLPVASSVDLFSDLSYVSRTIGTTDTGYRITLGAKSKVASAVELMGAYSYVDVGSSTYNAFTGGLRVNVTDTFYGYGRYTSMTGTNSITTYSLGVGMNF